MSSTNPTFSNLNPNNPLNSTHLDNINMALRAVEQGLAQAELAQSAGLDVTQKIADLNAQKAQLLKFKAVYFPGL